MMDSHGHPPALVSILIGALIAWRLYSRFRRTVGAQRLSLARLWISVTVFPILGALLLALSIHNPWAPAALVGGIAIGVGLGVYGLRLTRFEVTDAGLYYTPNAYLGIALSALLILRILYRIWWQGGLFPDSSAAGAPPQMPATPFTLLLFGAFAGYYTTYAIGLLRWRHSVRDTQPLTTQPAGLPPEAP